MTTVSETESSLTTKCLDFCRALAGQGKAFKFEIAIGSTFSLDTRVDKDTLSKRIKKRCSPPTLKRNARRREEFLSKKSTSESASPSGMEPIQEPRKQCKAFQNVTSVIQNSKQEMA